MTRKITIISLALAVFVILFVSLRINKAIHTRESTHIFGNDTIHYTEKLKWKRGNLESIDYGDGNIIKFEYGEKNRLVKTIYDKNKTICYFYNDKLLHKVEIYSDTVFSEMFELEYIESKISKIEGTVYHLTDSERIVKHQKERALSLVFPGISFFSIFEFCKEAIEKNNIEAGTPCAYTIDLTWEGEDLVKKVFTSGNHSRTSVITYDRRGGGCPVVSYSYE